MDLIRFALVSLLLAMPMIQGCSKPVAAPATATTASAATAGAETAETPSPATAKACDMVTSAEMSSILGSTVVGTPDESSNGKTECLYKPAETLSPHVDLAVTWGDGEVAMGAAA